MRATTTELSKIEKLEVILENVRCFRGWHEVPVRPLTLLVGDNSTGKSTFLAVVHALRVLLDDPLSPSFNQRPYRLGSFDNIYPSTAVDEQRLRCFKIGVKGTTQIGEEAEGARLAGTVIATYGEERGKVVTLQLDMGTDKARLHIFPKAGEMRLVLEYENPKNREWTKSEVVARLPAIQRGRDFGTFGLVRWAYFSALDRKKRPLDEEFNAFMQCTAFASQVLPHGISLAPIRMRPERTYDDLEDDFVPEGNHIPALLRNISLEGKPSEQSDRVIQALEEFGSASGLFSGVIVTPLKGPTTSAFQIMVSMGDHQFNLADVGYGVSQCLPIIVETALQRTEEASLLLQQPEVHLHPRAQAALGSFFCRMAQMPNCRLVIETHSDYLLDRVRQEVAQRKIPEDKVALLFFERTEEGVVVHDIKLDRFGNLIDPPQSYRSFFLQETTALLSRGTQ